MEEQLNQWQARKTLRQYHPDRLMPGGKSITEDLCAEVAAAAPRIGKRFGVRFDSGKTVCEIEAKTEQN